MIKERNDWHQEIPEKQEFTDMFVTQYLAIKAAGNEPINANLVKMACARATYAYDAWIKKCDDERHDSGW